MLASLSCWRSVSFSAFFQSAKRASLRSLASCWLPARLASFADLAADLIQRFGGGFDDMKRVQGDDCVWAALGDRPGDPLGVVAGDELDLLAALFAQQVQELLDRLAVPAVRRPDQAAGVMIDHHGQVLLAFADRDLIEPEGLQARVEVASLLGLGGHSRADTPDRPPRDPDQHTDRFL